MISLVDDTFSDRRSMSDASRIVGNAEKSSGRSMKSVTVKINIASANDAASPASRTQEGIGKIIMAMIAINAIASKTVGLGSQFEGVFANRDDPDFRAAFYFLRSRLLRLINRAFCLAMLIIRRPSRNFTGERGSGLLNLLQDRFNS